MIEAVCERIVKHNRPDLVPRARYFNDLLQKIDFIPKDATITQYGCACGYMLDVLRINGYEKLTGVDNDSGMEKDWVPDTKFVCSTARWALKDLPKPDVALFHRFLFTLPPTERTDDLYKLVANGFKKYLIVMEEETGTQVVGSPAVYFNNYKDIFEGLGLKQIYEDTSFCKEVVFRIFTK